MTITPREHSLFLARYLTGVRRLASYSSIRIQAI